MSFPKFLEIQTDHTTISLWYEEGCPAELEMAEPRRYPLCQELEPDEARRLAEWLLAYADAAGARSGGG